MKYNDLINELMDLLDKNEDICKIKSLKRSLLNDIDFMNQLNNYKLNPNIESKKKLFSNLDYKSYLESEENINFLILKIKDKFKIFNSRKCIKWKL